MSTRPSQSADIAILVALEKELDAVLRSAGSWERHQASAAGALAAVWSRASAIEMEAAGIAAALDQSVDAPGCVMVKAICDRADASKDDSWQEYAAEVAAAFVASFVFGFLEPSDARGQKKDLPDLTSDKATPALAPERPTFRE